MRMKSQMFMYLAKHDQSDLEMTVCDQLLLACLSSVVVNFV